MKHKLSSLFAILIILIILLSALSCTQDQPNLSDISKEIKISASIDGTSNKRVKTRASDSNWDAGDAIGVFMKRSKDPLSSALALNTKYVTADGTSTFAPATSNGIYFPFQNEKVDFIAYYPFKEASYDLNYIIDVSNQSNLAEIDLLYADNVKGIVSSIDNVNLSFKHQLSKIVLHITMVEDGSDLNGLKAEITDVNTKALFSLVNGSISNESEPQNISFNVSKNGAMAEAILLPTTSLTNKKLVFTLGENSYSYDLSNSTIEAFDKSTKYTMNVRLKPGVGAALEVISSSILDWTSGGIAEDIDVDEDPIENDIEEGEGVGEGTGEGTEGDGTETNPYTVKQAKEKVGETGKWVKGYIVGSYGTSIRTKSFMTGKESALQGNIAIASLETESDSLMTFPIDLIDNTTVREKINLSQNPTNLGKMVLLYGNIVEIQKHPGLKKVTNAILINKDF